MDHRVARVIRQMQENPKQPWAATVHAAKLGISASHLRRLVKSDLGVAPSVYLHRYRLARARELLLTTPLSIKQVMISVGCNDPSHFVRSFERHFGLSPRRYRRARLALEGCASDSANK
jgi:transcriptional regulator GlxA family with amidase domain